MTKESTYNLQRIDCNCNDCYFMVRDFEKYTTSLELHQTWQFTAFELKKNNLIKKSEEWAVKEEYIKATELVNEANNLRFIFDRSKVLLNYGNCSKFQKEVSFIPNTCQIETQKCFIHRRDIKQQTPLGR